MYFHVQSWILSASRHPLGSQIGAHHHFGTLWTSASGGQQIVQRFGSNIRIFPFRPSVELFWLHLTPDKELCLGQQALKAGVSQVSIFIKMETNKHTLINGLVQENHKNMSALMKLWSPWEAQSSSSTYRGEAFLQCEYAYNLFPFLVHHCGVGAYRICCHLSLLTSKYLHFEHRGNYKEVWLFHLFMLRFLITVTACFFLFICESCLISSCWLMGVFTLVYHQRWERRTNDFHGDKRCNNKAKKQT